MERASKRGPTLGLVLLLVSGALLGSAAQADEIVLANGDKINGEIIEWSVTHVVIEHPQLGPLRLELDQLQLDTGTPPTPGLLGTGFLRGWDRRIDFGLNGKNGNSESLNITTGVRFRYRDDWKRWNLDGRYFYNTSDDDDNDNNMRMDLRRDWLRPESRWFWRLGGRYQYDQFEAWENRITVSPGIGYNLIETERHDFDVVLGPAYTREFGEAQDDKAETLLVFDWDWKISERQSFEASNNFFMEMAPQGGEYRNFTTAQWRLRLTKRPAISLNMGVENEYDSDPEPGDQENDIKYFMTLGIDL